jgi:hypothetical protein
MPPVTATQEIARRICEIPAEFHRRAVSVVQLVWDSGCESADAVSLRRALEERLRTHPELIDDWLTYSADKRTSSGWFFQDDDVVTVGYFEADRGISHEQHFSDRLQACAEFIMREIESIGARKA